MPSRCRLSRNRCQHGSSALVVEVLGGRRLLAANVAVASDAGPSSSPLVRLIDAETGFQHASTLAFESSFKGGVRLAMGRVTGNAAADVVAGTGFGCVAEVRVLKPVTSGGTTMLTPVFSLKPFGASYRGGVEVAVGDVDGDTIEDIIVAKSREGGDVKVFRMTNQSGAPTAVLYAVIANPFGAFYRGGASVGVADVGQFTNGVLTRNLGDNRVEILVGSGVGVSAEVRVYDISRPTAPRLVDAITPAFNKVLGQPFRGGVTVTSGRYAASGVADSIDDIVVSAGRGHSSSAQTIVYDGTVAVAANKVLKAFTTYGAGQRPAAPVFTAAVDVDRNGQVDRFLVTQGDPGGPTGLANVSVEGVRSMMPITSLAGPLRIAAARTVFQSQTIDAIVSTPSPTTGIPAGAVRPMLIRDVVTGFGATAKVGDTLTVHYTAMLADGTVIDTSRKTGRTSFQFVLGAGQVIAGWEVGPVGMKPGGRRLFVIPPELAYGDAGRSVIPSGSTTYWDVELLSAR